MARELRRAMRRHSIGSRKLPIKGNASAQHILGVCYNSGMGVARSDEKAFVLWQKAANQGNAQAQLDLGFCYNNGRGVAQSYEKAIEWYQKAAKQSHAEAQYILGACYHNGRGVAQSSEKAFEWYQKAADQGHVEAQHNLGVCYYNGEGVAADSKKAKWFFKLAAKQGYAAAHSMLARLEAESGKDANLQKAQKHIRKAQAAIEANDSLDSVETKRLAQRIYTHTNLAFYLRCGNEGCSVAYSEDVSVQSAKLKSCARCRKVAYCSLECQREDWKARHKEECGKRLVVGENFLLCKWSSRPELNGCRVEVEVGMDEATRAVGVRVVSEEEEGEGKEEEDGEERKADAAEGCNVGGSAVGLAMSVKPMNLKKEQ